MSVIRLPRILAKHVFECDPFVSSAPSQLVPAADHQAKLVRMLFERRFRADCVACLCARLPGARREVVV